MYDNKATSQLQQMYLRVSQKDVVFHKIIFWRCSAWANDPFTLFLDITRITKLLISYYRQNIRDDEILFHHSDLFDKRTGRVLLWKLWKSIYVYLLNCKEIAFAAAAHIILFGML